MPRCLDPQNWFPVWLDSDADKPESERPTFLFRYLNSREELRMTEVAEKLYDVSSASEKSDILFDCLGIGVCGWLNMRGPDGESIPYMPERMRDLLSNREAMELLDKMMRGMVPNGETQKKSESPSPSDSGNFAKPAAAVSVESDPNRPENTPG